MISTRHSKEVKTQVAQALQRDTASPSQNVLKPYLSPAPLPLSLQVANFQVLAPANLHTILPLNLYATDIDGFKPHVQLVAGRWPVDNPSGMLETLLTPDQAQQLGLSPGATMQIKGNFMLPINANNTIDPGASDTITIRMRLVGLVKIPPAYLNATGVHITLAKSRDDSSFTLFTSTNALLKIIDHIATLQHNTTVFTYDTFTLAWTYQVQLGSVRYDQIPDLLARLASASSSILNLHTGPGNSSTFPYVNQVTFTNTSSQARTLYDLLNQYTNWVKLVDVPLFILSAQIIALLLLLVCMLMSMLVDRQMAANALLSSRGASHQQIFWSLFFQGIGICLPSALLGPFIGVALVSMLTLRVLPATGATILHQTSNAAGQIVPVIALSAGGTLLIALCALGLLLRYSIGTNILALRREMARLTRQPFWQRFYLDVVALCIALSGFGVSLYAAQIARQLDSQTQELIVAPLTLVAPLFLLLACLLLFLRVYPWALLWGALDAQRTRGITGMLALAQMARTPRQTVRMIMLLSLALAFAIFTQVFDASQIQRANDISSYEAGADFSGTQLNPMLELQPFNTIVTSYTSLPGVLAVNPGFTSQGEVLDNAGENIAVTMLAVDSKSFARTIIWGVQECSQSLPRLLASVSTNSDKNLQTLKMPVIVDQAMANQLQLQIGSLITKPSMDGMDAALLSFQVVGIIQHIPTLNGSADAGDSPGGMLTDYTTLKAFAKADWSIEQALAKMKHPSPFPGLLFNHIWLRTLDNSHDLATIRQALSLPAYGLGSLYDRRAILADLQSDPLAANIEVILGLGGITALLLALAGHMISSWLNIHLRRRSFVVLRALGTKPRQIVAILLWEQGMVYLGAIVLGLAFGLFLPQVLVPILVFTGLPQHGPLSLLGPSDFYLVQHVIPITLVIPPSLDLILFALLLLSLLTLLMTIFTALQPSVSNELRQSED